MCFLRPVFTSVSSGGILTVAQHCGVLRTHFPHQGQCKLFNDIFYRAYSSAMSIECTIKDVKHDVKKCEFYLPLTLDKTDGVQLKDKAVLNYSWITPTHADMYHTEVPASQRGKGIAKLLAKAAMEFVVKEDAQMTLTCTYLQKYVHDNPRPEYTSRVVK